MAGWWAGTYVTSTDTDIGNADDDIVGILDHGNRSVFKAGISRAVEQT